MQILTDFIIVPFYHSNGKVFNNKKYRTICDTCNAEIGFRIKKKNPHLCGSCTAKRRIKIYGNPMLGKSQDASKFRPSYSNVDYKVFKLNKRKKRLYKMTCIQCGSDRGYKIHNEALRPCLKCHTKRYTKKTKEQRKIYNAIKASISARFKNRDILKQEGAFRHLPYTVQDLIKHLESQFEPWMNWDNYGPYCAERKTWQIDHIVPDSHYSYTTIDDQGFKDSWALHNLRPLESIINIMKSSRLHCTNKL